MSAELLSLETSPSGLQMAIFSLQPVFCASELESAYNGTSQTGSVTQTNVLISLYFSKCNHILGLSDYLSPNAEEYR